MLDGIYHVYSNYNRLFSKQTVETRPGTKYFENYSNTLQLLSLINNCNYVLIIGHMEFNDNNYTYLRNVIEQLQNSLKYSHKIIIFYSTQSLQANDTKSTSFLMKWT